MANFILFFLKFWTENTLANMVAFDILNKCSSKVERLLFFMVELFGCLANQMQGKICHHY
jgi:hypothetical protein